MSIKLSKVSIKLNSFCFILSGYKYQVSLFLARVCCTGLLFFCHNLAAKPFNKLVWSDEFNKPGLPDRTRWNYNTGTGYPQVCGCGNNELQYYTKKRGKNTRIENEYLIIEAQKEEYSGSFYTSVRLLIQSNM